MNKLLLIICIIVGIIPVCGREIVSEHLKGTIGGSPVVFELISSDTSMSGSYYYEKIGIPLTISGEMNPDASYSVEEYDGEVVTGKMLVTYTDTGLAGTWSSPDGKIKLPIIATYADNVIRFTVRRIEVIKHLFNDPAKPVCTVNLRYLEPTVNPNGATPKSLNALIMKAYFGDFCRSNLPESAAVFVKDFQSGFIEMESNYEELKKEGYPFAEWVLEQGMSIVFNGYGLVTLSIDQYSFAGGAHPNGSTSYLVIDIVNGRKLTFDDIFVAGSTDKLTDMITQTILQPLIDMDASITRLTDAGFYDDRIAPNNNFSVTKAGIYFHYNAYEASPYVVGPSEAFLPFSQIKDLIKKDSPIKKLF